MQEQSYALLKFIASFLLVLYSIAVNVIHQIVCLAFHFKCSSVYIIKYTNKQRKNACN